MMKSYSVFFLLLQVIISGHGYSYDSYNTWTYYYTTFAPPPPYSKYKDCSSVPHLYSTSQLPYSASDSNFYCGNSWYSNQQPSYIRIRTQIEGPFRLLVTVKNFETRGSANEQRGFWISNSYKTSNFNPGSYRNLTDYYDINCLYNFGCSFTADTNSNVDILMYFDSFSTNSYSFVIEDLTAWKPWMTFIVVLIAVVIFLLLLGHYIKVRRIATSSVSARMDRIPDGPVVSLQLDARTREEQHLYEPPTIPSYEPEHARAPMIPDGPRVYDNIL